jgi:hypothetical protein
LDTTAGSRSHGLGHAVAVLVDVVAADLDRVGLDLRIVVVAVRRAREPVAVDVEVHVVGEPVAVLVDPVGQDLARAGEDRGLASLQSTPEAKLSPSPSMPVSHSAMTSVKSLRTESLPAPQEIRSAFPSSAWIVSLPSPPE